MESLGQLSVEINNLLNKITESRLKAIQNACLMHVSTVWSVVISPLEANDDNAVLSLVMDDLARNCGVFLNSLFLDLTFCCLRCTNVCYG